MLKLVVRPADNVKLKWELLVLSLSYCPVCSLNCSILIFIACDIGVDVMFFTETEPYR